MKMAEKNITALTVAKFFLSIPDEDAGELVSNLKLQKLLYYAQGICLGLNGAKAPLFADKIYAWKHGPVVKTVYNHYAKYGDGPIPQEKTPILDKELSLFLDKVYGTFGKFSAWALRDMTHREAPWLNNYVPEKRDVEIPLVDLAKFFRTQVK